MIGPIIEFLRKRDYIFLRELGQGACGRTVLLRDPELEQDFVCKKFSPLQDEWRKSLFDNFVRETKILHLLGHPNVVRVYNYYLYRDQFAGYILMEYIEGTDIEDFLLANPYKVNSVFEQLVEGFLYLERNAILHRDIRPKNILVTKDGEVKIIDFGFGKRVGPSIDFDKSITLNWWCAPPKEFEKSTYDFGTEVYFVGKLIELIRARNAFDDFRYGSLLDQMCEMDPSLRIATFSRVRQLMLAGQLEDLSFAKADLSAYRDFANELSMAVSKIEQSAKYFEDDEIEKQIRALYKSVMLEEELPSNSKIVGCFVNGSYYFKKLDRMAVETLRCFLDFLGRCNPSKKGVVFGNLRNRLDSVDRYREAPVPPFPDEDIPF